MQIFHEYRYGNKKKVINTLAGLKKYCTINDIPLAEFLSNTHNFSFEIMSEKIEKPTCNLCSALLKIQRNGIDCENKVIKFVVCSCAEDNPLQVTEKRFYSVFSNDMAKEKYKDYCQRKTKNWQPENPDNSSLRYYSDRFGNTEGKLKYEEKNKKCDTVSKEYFLKKGFTQEEAIAKQRERQATFSLETCIKKYGLEDGTQIFANRQVKWQNTLLSKSDEELERINQAKIWNGKGYSKVSQELFEKLDLFGARYGEKSEKNLGEKLIRLSNGKMAMVDYYFAGKIIEFYGDYWHANPVKYKAPVVFTKYSSRGINITAEQVWQEDANRISLIEEQGFKVLVIWENDYKTNPQKTIETCLEFLCSI
jgi:G:T-mismatch repair DNA endonuclease (very short patch repair protein)